MFAYRYEVHTYKFPNYVAKRSFIKNQLLHGCFELHPITNMYVYTVIVWNCHTLCKYYITSSLIMICHAEILITPIFMECVLFKSKSADAVNSRRRDRDRIIILTLLQVLVRVEASLSLCGDDC